MHQDENIKKSCEIELKSRRPVSDCIFFLRDYKTRIDQGCSKFCIKSVLHQISSEWKLSARFYFVQSCRCFKPL